jgi:hypothetical protein
MGRCKVVLEHSFKRELVQLSERAQDRVAIVIQSLENECGFDPDPAQYILQVENTQLQARSDK